MENTLLLRAIIVEIYNNFKNFMQSIFKNFEKILFVKKLKFFFRFVKFMYFKINQIFKKKKKLLNFIKKKMQNTYIC